MNNGRRYSYYALMIGICIVGAARVARSYGWLAVMITLVAVLAVSIGCVWIAMFSQNRKSRRAVLDGAEYAAVFKVKGGIELFPGGLEEGAYSRTFSPGDVSGVATLKGGEFTLSPFKILAQKSLGDRSWNTAEITFVDSRLGREFTGLSLEEILLRVDEEEVAVSLVGAQWARAGKARLSEAWPTRYGA